MTCAHCHAQMPPTGGRCPRCGRVTYARMGRPGAEGGIRLDGCKPEPASPKDFRAVPRAMALPTVVNLRPECSAVEQQGQLGSCTANAIIGAFEFTQRKATGRAQDLSRLFVYYNARMMSGAERQDAGATIGHGMAALLAFGAPPEAEWPYDVSAMATRPTEAAYEQARNNVPADAPGWTAWSTSGPPSPVTIPWCWPRTSRTLLRRGVHDRRRADAHVDRDVAVQLPRWHARHAARGLRPRGEGVPRAQQLGRRLRRSRLLPAWRSMCSTP